MAENNKAGKAGVVLGGAALVTAAIALVKRQAARAAPGEGGVLSLDQATMDLLMAMAQTTADLEDLVNQILGSLGVGEGVTLNVQGYPPNTDGIISGRVEIVAVNRPYGLPDIVVPDDMILQIKGWPMNAGLIYVAGMRTSATNVNQIWPLLANEAIGYRIKNAKEIHISGTAAGDWAVYTVEQRRLGY